MTHAFLKSDISGGANYQWGDKCSTAPPPLNPPRVQDCEPSAHGVIHVAVGQSAGGSGAGQGPVPDAHLDAASGGRYQHTAGAR